MASIQIASFSYTLLMMLVCMQASQAGRLVVTLLRADVDDLDSVGWTPASDVYVYLGLFGEANWRAVSSEKDGTNSPEWNEAFDYGDGIPQDAVVDFQAWDSDFPLDPDLVGFGTFNAAPSGDRTVTVEHGTFYFLTEYTPYNPCPDDNGGCGYNSVCTFTGNDNGRTCACETGYESPSGDGRNCDPINLCAANNGNCGQSSKCTFTGPNARVCECESGYESPNGDGTQCTAVNQCEKTPDLCGSNSICEPDETSYTCTCEAGYESESGRDCTPINRCREDNGGCDLESEVCVYEGPGERVCACKKGFEQQGDTCVETDDCEQRSCDENANCFNEKGPGNFQCVCKSGYFQANNDADSPSEVVCEPIDRCEVTPDICGTFSRCEAIGPDTYQCTCQDDYESPNGRDCRPINACLSNNGGCGANSTCTSTGANNASCACDNGYESMSGDGRGCQPINACLVSNGGCGNNTNCVFTGPATRNCTCVANHEPTDGDACKPINACLKGLDDCDPSAFCVFAGAGSWTCVCPVGYRSFIAETNEKACEQINPCLENDPCPEDSTCIHTGPDLYACRCNNGFDYVFPNGTIGPVNQTFTDGSCTPADDADGGGSSSPTVVIGASAGAAVVTLLLFAIFCIIGTCRDDARRRRQVAEQTEALHGAGPALIINETYNPGEKDSFLSGENDYQRLDSSEVQSPPHSASGSVYNRLGAGLGGIMAAPPGYVDPDAIGAGPRAGAYESADLQPGPFQSSGTVPHEYEAFGSFGGHDFSSDVSFGQGSQAEYARLDGATAEARPASLLSSNYDGQSNAYSALDNRTRRSAGATSEPEYQTPTTLGRSARASDTSV